MFIHPSAIVDPGAQIGERTRVWHFTHICASARIGMDCVLGQNVYVGPDVEIGRGCKVQNNVSLYAGVRLADDVFLGPSCVFTNVVRPRAHVDRKNEFASTEVGRGVSVGANATIVCGHRLGDYAFIGAGAVVTGDVPPHALVYGHPAEIRGWVCRCGEKLPEGADVRCSRCGDRYRVDVSGCHRVER